MWTYLQYLYCQIENDWALTVTSCRCNQSRHIAVGIKDTFTPAFQTRNNKIKEEMNDFIPQLNDVINKEVCPCDAMHSGLALSRNFRIGMCDAYEQLYVCNITIKLLVRRAITFWKATFT